MSNVIRSRAAMRAAVFALALLLGGSAASQAQSTLRFPLIKGVGGVHPLPRAAEQPRRGAKVLFDVTNGDLSEVVTRPARLLNLYAQAGIMPGADLRVALVFHGKATPFALSTDARGKRQLPALPAFDTLRALAAAGVELFVCGQSAMDSGFAAGELAPDVKLAVSALNVVANKHLDGYVTILVP